MSGLIHGTTRRGDALFACCALHSLRGGLGRCPIGIRTIQPDAFGASLSIELRADYVPALAEMKDAVMQLGGPALRRDADPVAFAHPVSLRVDVCGRTRRQLPGRRSRPRARCPAGEAVRSNRA